MKLIRYINYYVQCFSIVLLILGGLLATIFKEHMNEIYLEDIGIMVLIVTPIYLGLFQIMFSFFSVLIYRTKSVFKHHLAYSILFFVLVGLVSYGIEEHFYSDAFEMYVNDNRILVGIIGGSIPVVLLIYYYTITFDKLNPYKLYKEL